MDSLRVAIASSMDAPESLVEHLPALVAGLEDLGARAADVVAACAKAGLGSASRILDLGCGKGSAGLSLAMRHGCSVLGIDGVPAFVEHAREAARAAGLGERCRFEQADIRTLAGHEAPYDLVMMLALGDTLGDPSETMSSLRRWVRPGGLMLIDDAYLADGAPHDSELAEAYGFRTDVVAALEQHGDQVVDEQIVDGPESAHGYAAIAAQLAQRAQALAKQHPEVAEDALAFAESQRAAVAMLASPIVGALFLVLRQG